ncbi:MAG TPA: FAD-dependent oxidoreductase [Sphingobacteriaceae bacterium]|nr:FAD-dependent oxidoreductase [Sphingobacteriaceae bacterium]
MIGVVGGGIIGLAMAYKLQKQYPGAKLLVFEKENALGQHQSGRNSGVLHCGLYYQPGSLTYKGFLSFVKHNFNFALSEN